MEQIRQLIKSYLKEDIGSGDVTTNSIVPRGMQARGEFVAKEECVVAGLEMALETFRILDPGVRTKIIYGDGQVAPKGKVIAIVRGKARALLTGERVALNILQRLSGVATETRRYVVAVQQAMGRKKLRISDFGLRANGGLRKAGRAVASRKGSLAPGTWRLTPDPWSLTSAKIPADLRPGLWPPPKSRRTFGLTPVLTPHTSHLTAFILDTRKTTPGWRELEKYAVRCGGGMNHRMGLWDAVLIKDNHIAVAGGVSEAVERARIRRGGPAWPPPRIHRRVLPRRAEETCLPIEVEVTNLRQLREALTAGVERILLDNMTPQQVKRCVEVVRKSPSGDRVIVECSGGMTLRTIAAYARTGVDWISVGALTHSARAVDVSFEIRPGKESV